MTRTPWHGRSQYHVAREALDTLPAMILQVRVRRGLTQQQAADEAGIPRGTWRGIEALVSRPSPRGGTLATLNKLLEWLDEHVDVFE